MAKFADGKAVATLGDTSVLTTAVCKNRSATGSGTTTSVSSFVPLTVDYRYTVNLANPMKLSTVLSTLEIYYILHWGLFWSQI